MHIFIWGGGHGESLHPASIKTWMASDFSSSVSLKFIFNSDKGSNSSVNSPFLNHNGEMSATIKKC